MNILEKLNNIDEQCSQFSESDDKMQIDDDLYASDKFTSSSDNEEDIIIDKSIGQNKKRLLLITESESDFDDQHVETSADGIILEVTETISKPRRTLAHNIFNEKCCSTGYACCFIVVHVLFLSVSNCL